MRRFRYCNRSRKILMTGLDASGKKEKKEQAEEEDQDDEKDGC